MRKALVLFSVCTALMAGKVSAQNLGHDYETAVGFKFWPGALTVKHFLNEQSAVEGLVSFWDHGFRVTGLFEIHGDIDAAPGLKWYVGPGAHVGRYTDGWSHNDYYYGDGGASFGFDGVLGLEYKINQAPIAISLDIQPYLELLHHPFVDVWGGLGVKYTF